MEVPRILKPPGKSFFLLGPRGTGKSTWLRKEFPDAHVVNLLSEETYHRLLGNPGQFAAELRAVPPVLRVPGRRHTVALTRGSMTIP
ncbi:MAG: hypothetical protein JXR77_14785 [Lentisphaeria bacterium]|nr:hypothetical protein [Lentisphaeria bacterium]